MVVGAKYGVTARTRRRYKRDFTAGKILIPEIASDTFKQKFANLDPVDIRKIRRDKFKATQHYMEGYLTQRQLIKYLQQEYNLLRKDRSEGVARHGSCSV
jgi:hypothetical protein